MNKILIIHGPNLNMLGKREPELYGSETLDQINQKCIQTGKSIGIEIDTLQSNSETEIIEAIQTVNNKYDGLIINPAAFTHTSVAIRDALAMSEKPKIEVHLSNIYKREEFRHNSLTAPECDAQITGLKSEGYIVAIKGIQSLTKEQ